MEYLDGFSSSCGTDLATELFYIGINFGFSVSVSNIQNKARHRVREDQLVTDKISNFCTVGTSVTSMKIYSTMKHLRTVPDNKNYHHALVPEFPCYDVKYLSTIHNSEEYVVLGSANEMTNQSETEKITSEQENSECNNYNADFCSDCVSSQTCEICRQKQDLISDSSKPSVNRQIVEVQPFLHQPSVKAFTPISKKSNSRLGNFSTKLVISPCVKLELGPEDSLFCNIESPLRNVNLSSPKFCSTPVSTNQRHGQFSSFNNESSIYSELMEAEENFTNCRRFNNVPNKCETYSLSSSYYSVSDNSDVEDSFNSVDDHSITTECSKLKRQVKKPLTCSSVEILLDETQIVYDALKKYKKELEISEAKFNLSHMVLNEELSESEKDSVDELKFLRAEIRKEIDIMEKQLENRSKSLNNGCQNFNPLVCLEVVDKMMDLISLNGDC